MKQRTERQHFVPCFYLDCFSDEDGYVYVLDVEKEQIRKQNIKDICVVKNLYETKWENANKSLGKYVLDNQVEQGLSRLESRTSPILKNINDRLDSGEQIAMSHQEKDTIFEYIASQYLRVPYVLESTKKYYDGVEDDESVEVLNRVVKGLFKVFNWGSAESLFRHSVVVGSFDRDIPGSPLNVICNVFSKMKMVFWNSENGVFVTSSFPLHIDGENETDATRIVFPIGDHNAIVLFAQNLPFLKDGMVLKVSSDITEEINIGFLRKYKKGIVRYIIASKKNVLEKILFYGTVK